VTTTSDLLELIGRVCVIVAESARAAEATDAKYDTLLAGQRETFDLLLTLSTRITRMATDIERIQGALDGIAADQTTEAAAIGSIAKEIGDLANAGGATAAQLKTLADKAEALKTAADANASALNKLATPPAPAGGVPTQEIPS
jgi:hypothetical protein